MKLRRPDGGEWNNGDLSKLPAAMRRIRVATSRRIEAPGAAVRARLAGLVSAEGPVRDDALGERLLRGSGLGTWVMALSADDEPERGQLALLHPRVAMGLLDLRVRERDGGTEVELELVYTALSEHGSAVLAGANEREMASWLEELAGVLGGTDAPSTPARPAESLPAHRVTRERTIRADADTVFPLACPVAELDWIDDWSFDLLYSESGRNELFNLFAEAVSGAIVLRSPEAMTYWYTTTWDRERRRFEAILLTEDLCVAHWRFDVVDLGDGRCTLRAGVVSRPMTPAGASVLAEPGQDGRMRDMLDFVLHSAATYAEKGTVYRLSTNRKLGLAISVIAAKIGRHWRSVRSGARRLASEAHGVQR